MLKLQRPFWARGSSLLSRLRPVAKDAILSTDLPTFTILIQAGSKAFLDTTLQSLSRQKIGPIETLILGDGALNARSLAFATECNVKIRAERALGPAIMDAVGDYIICLDARDELLDGALSAFADRIDGDKLEIVYCDETAWPGNGQPMRPRLKPDWSPELLTSYDYFGRATAIRTELARRALQLGNALATSDIAVAEWDLKLRAASLTGSIGRIAAVLCRRNGQIGVEADLQDKGQALREVLAAHWRREGYCAEIRTLRDGTFHAVWPLDDRPLVSVIIPNKNRAHLLRACTSGLSSGTAYGNIEIIVVDNASTEDETRTLYADLESQVVKIVAFDEPFNYSRACNRGAQAARGSLLLFLNNDIEIVEPDWLETLVREVQRPGVGIVGAKLVYPDGDIQHAGVAMGLFQLAAHVFHRAPHGEWGPFGSPDTQRNWLAVTGACQLIRRSVFDLVNGYDETFQLAYSDVVLCLDAWRFGFRTVYAPAAQLIHHEGASRGVETPTEDQKKFAWRLRALGVVEDPFFHPKIAKDAFIPEVDETIRPDTKPGMCADIETIGELGDEESPNLYDDGSVGDAIGRDWSRIAGPFDPARLTIDADGGGAIVLQFIRRRADIRRRFPDALHTGAGGAFALWLKTEGLVQLGLSPAYASAIDAAFAADFAGPVFQKLLFDDSFRCENPLFLLPNGRTATCRYLFDAINEGAVTAGQAWWFLLECAENPSRALYLTWAVTPSWQAAVPDGGTAFGMTRLIDWVAKTYAVDDAWLYRQFYPDLMGSAAQLRLAYSCRPEWRALHPRPFSSRDRFEAFLTYLSTGAAGLNTLARAWLAEQNKEALFLDVQHSGLNILGHLSYPSGLRISAESLAEGLRQNEFNLSLRDVPVSLATDEPIRHRFQGVEIYDTTLIHVQPEPLFDVAYESSGLHPRAARTYRIGFWYWEFGEIPESWDRAALACDELWAATRFVADGLRQRYRQPIHVFMPGVEIAPFDILPRSFFKLPEERFLFVFVFHMTSVMDRKNPLGLIKAFSTAFRPDENVQLVIKTTFGEQHSEQFAVLAAAAEAAGVHLINESYSRNETLSLIAASDAYISLHRSEGLGLTMAEAMLLGKPVIATRYSGNLDFMDDNNSLLVDHTLYPLTRAVPPYESGLVWADPSIPHAASLMRRLYEDRAFAKALGAKAKADLEKRLTYRAAGAAMAARLRDIEAGL
jgi:GT2 family glycosyltransferase/glycosyltransferase involved in cell wall biosynthesis